MSQSSITKRSEIDIDLENFSNVAASVHKPDSKTLVRAQRFLDWYKFSKQKSTKVVDSIRLNGTG